MVTINFARSNTIPYTMNIAPYPGSLLAIPLLLIACSSEDGGDDCGLRIHATDERSCRRPPKRMLQRLEPTKWTPRARPAEAARCQLPEATGPVTTMTFAENSHGTFGTIDEGDAVTHVFQVHQHRRHTRSSLDRCKGSCGCTVPQCPKEPIAPGAEGEIEVKFNSKGKKNKQTKTVTINANTVPEQTRITIFGRCDAGSRASRRREVTPSR